MDRHIATQCINFLKAVHALIKEAAADTPDYDMWSDRSDDTIIAMIYHLAESIGLDEKKKISCFTTFPWDHDWK